MMKVMKMNAINVMLDVVFRKAKDYKKDEALKEANNYRSIEQIRIKV